MTAVDFTYTDPNGVAWHATAFRAPLKGEHFVSSTKPCRVVECTDPSVLGARVIVERLGPRNPLQGEPTVFVDGDGDRLTINSFGHIELSYVDILGEEHRSDTAVNVGDIINPLIAKLMEYRDYLNGQQ